MAIKKALANMPINWRSVPPNPCSGTCCAAGGVEAIITALTLKTGYSPTINYETPDPDCDLDYVPNKARRQECRFALSNSFGFGGHNACLALARFDE